MADRLGFGYLTTLCLGGFVGGILWCDSQNRKMWAKISEDSTCQGIAKIRNQQCVVCLESESDYNGAINLMRANIDFKSLQNWNIPIIYKRIMHPDEIRPLLDQIKS